MLCSRSPGEFIPSPRIRSEKRKHSPSPSYLGFYDTANISRTPQKMPPNYFEVNSFRFKSIITKKVTLHFFSVKSKYFLFTSSQKSYLSRSENRTCLEHTGLFVLPITPPAQFGYSNTQLAPWCCSGVFIVQNPFDISPFGSSAFFI